MLPVMPLIDIGRRREDDRGRRHLRLDLPDRNGRRETEEGQGGNFAGVGAT
jgi:hypothetical protein